LDQLAQVLSHNETALLVEPGSIQGLVDAIGLLVKDGALRERLGAQARQTAIARHTWKQNVMHVLDRVREIPNPSVPAPAAAEKQLAHSGLQ
jgi:glycosyltransferase involved in cell wall biosynthesis